MPRLFRRSPARAPAVPDGRRVYAVGDIHGRRDLLDALLEQIAADAAEQDGCETIFLGDYIDRGPDSAAVLDRLAAGPPAGHAWTLLRGNHEQALLDLLGEAPHPTTLPAWLDNGGREALTSWGVPTRTAYGPADAALLDALRAAVPPAHRTLLETTGLTHTVGDYLFVHAGIMPGIPLGEQKPWHLLWVREHFLDSRADHGVVVVHGHSISHDVEERPNRIGIDTGAYISGRLTALVLEGSSRRYLST